MTNPILNELYEVRRAILAEHEEDLADYLRAELEQLKASGHPVANIKQRKIRRTQSAKSTESPVESVSSPSGDR